MKPVANKSERMIRMVSDKFLGGDVVTAKDFNLMGILNGRKFGQVPELVIIENTHQKSKYTDMTWYNVTVDFESDYKLERDIQRKIEDTETTILNYESVFSSNVAVNSRAKRDRLIKAMKAVKKTNYNLNELAKELHATNVSKGFYADHDIGEDFDDPKLSEVIKRTTANEKLLLIITEIAEIVEECRKPEPNKYKVEEEYADVFIRLLDSAAANGIDLDKALQEKRKKNDVREYKHGKRF